MKLYHGTRHSLLSGILQRGLVPRGTGKTNWKHAPSHKGAVYLTDAYAPYFAIQTAESLALVVEVESDLLNALSLLPDEDACEQCNRGNDDIEGSMRKRTAYYRNRLHLFNSGQWEMSLKTLGTCCHLGIIPPEAITRIAIIPRDYIWWWDASITLVNYQLLGPKYRAQTARMFGDKVEETPAWHDWQIKMDHSVYPVSNGKLGPVQCIEHPDERVYPKILADIPSLPCP